jgi:DNA-binding CsgD family transcriptional regulator
MRLSHADFAALQRTIFELHDHLDIEAFQVAVPGIFLKIIPADYFLVVNSTIGPATRRPAIMSWWESSPRMSPYLVAQMERFGSEHPFTQYSLKTADPTALKFSDFFSLREFRNTTLYNDFYRHGDFGRLLGVASFTSQGMATLNSVRGERERDFTERDRLILNLLRPHFDQARRNAERNSTRPLGGARPLASYGLSPRESEVASWLGKGKTNPEIAIILQMRTRAVEKHVERILEKLAVENRTAAALIIANQGGT